MAKRKWTKGRIRSLSSVKDRQHNGQKKMNQRENQMPFISEGQTTQWPKENEPKHQQWSTKHYMNTKDWAPWTKTHFRCSGKVNSSCSNSGTLRVTDCSLCLLGDIYR
jgi:hypothetical protein